jgi:SAM-dependent methyltransferase
MLTSQQIASSSTPYNIYARKSTGAAKVLFARLLQHAITRRSIIGDEVKTMTDIRKHNREAWDKWVDNHVEWTIPVDATIIEHARKGEWEIYLTEIRPVPRRWFPPLANLDVLCLASGGGQQGPVLSAAGANVTVFDNSPKQLDRDRSVAQKHALSLQTVEGDMRDLSIFADETFDLIVHPVSNIFVPDVRVVWKEAYRVLRPGGRIMSGLMNPMEYIFSKPALDVGRFEVKYALPYSDLDDMSESERIEAFGENEPLEWSHTLEDQLGGQIDAGFVITGFYEDYRKTSVVKDYFPSYMATLAQKPKQ